MLKEDGVDDCFLLLSFYKHLLADISLGAVTCRGKVFTQFVGNTDDDRHGQRTESWKNKGRQAGKQTANLF